MSETIDNKTNSEKGAGHAGWAARHELQRRDWEPLVPGGCVDLGYRQIHGMTVEDAILISAAPDMLDALEYARDEFERRDGAGTCPLEIIDAIESAKGVNPRQNTSE